MIYYLADLSSNSVKIGYTTPSGLKARMSNLKSSNSAELKLIGAHSGTRDKEHAIHIHLAAYKTRKRGEWFHMDTIVLEYIEQNNDFEYFFDVFETQIKDGQFNQTVYQRMLEAYSYERTGNRRLNIKVGQYSDSYKDLSEWIDLVHSDRSEDVSDIEENYYVEELEVMPYIWSNAKSTCNLN